MKQKNNKGLAGFDVWTESEEFLLAEHEYWAITQGYMPKPWYEFDGAELLEKI